MRAVKGAGCQWAIVSLAASVMLAPLMLKCNENGVRRFAGLGAVEGLKVCMDQRRHTNI